MVKDAKKPGPDGYALPPTACLHHPPGQSAGWHSGILHFDRSYVSWNIHPVSPREINFPPPLAV